MIPLYLLVINELAKFSHIHIEYHYGYKNLIQRLEKCGFKVSLLRRPILNFNPETKKKMYIGDIFAIRKT